MAKCSKAEVLRLRTALPLEDTSGAAPTHPDGTVACEWDVTAGREKIFKNYALKSMDEVRAKLRQAVLYIERNPNLGRSTTSFPQYRQLTLM